MRYHNTTIGYREPTLEIIGELNSNNPEIETIEHHAIEIAVLGNATHPKYAENIYERIQNRSWLDALNLATYLDNNASSIYEQARDNGIPNNSTQERTEKALENFEIEKILDSTKLESKNLEATH